jgi:superkiller protein 3
MRNRIVIVLLGCVLGACATEQAAVKEEKADTHYNLGVARLASGDVKQAIAEFGQAIGDAPDNSVYHNALGLAYLMDRRSDRAVASFQRAVQLDQNFSDAYNNLGSAFVQRADYDQAITAFRQALLNPAYLSPEQAHLNLGNVYMVQGRTADGVVEFKRALDILPDFAEAHNRLGYAYLVQGQLELAIAELTLGFAYLSADEKDRARQAFQKVVDLSPTSEMAAEAMRQLKRLSR